MHTHAQTKKTQDRERERQRLHDEAVLRRAEADAKKQAAVELEHAALLTKLNRQNQLNWVESERAKLDGALDTDVGDLDIDTGVDIDLNG